MNNSNKKASTLWILFSIIIFLSGMGFVYIGAKTSNRKWFIEGIIYEIPWIIISLLLGVQAPASVGVPFLGICFILMIVSLVRSLMVRKEYKRKIEYGNYNKVEKTGLTYIGALFCLIPFLNGLPFIYLGVKHKDARFIIGGIMCEALWFLINMIHGLVGVTLAGLWVSFILFIKIHYENPQKTYEPIRNTPKMEKPKSETAKPKVKTDKPSEDSYYKDYETQLNDLKQTYDKKESRIRKSINDKFNSSEITHSRFMNIIDNSHTNFYNQYDSAMKLIDLSTNRDLKIEEKLQKRANTLRMINEKMEELEVELIINDGDEKKTDEDFNELMGNMSDLIDSVKDYD